MALSSSLLSAASTRAGALRLVALAVAGAASAAAAAAVGAAAALSSSLSSPEVSSKLPALSNCFTSSALKWRAGSHVLCRAAWPCHLIWYSRTPFCTRMGG